MQPSCRGYVVILQRQTKETRGLTPVSRRNISVLATKYLQRPLNIQLQNRYGNKAWALRPKDTQYDNENSSPRRRTENTFRENPRFCGSYSHSMDPRRSGMAESVHLWSCLLFAGYDVVWKALTNIIHGSLFDEHFLMAVATIGAFCIKDFPRQWL